MILRFLQACFVYCLGALAVFSCLWLGNLCADYLGLLPGALYGMLLFTFALSVGKSLSFSVDVFLEQPVAVSLRYMPIVFIPVSVGIMRFGELLASKGALILFIGVTTTLSTISVVGLLGKRLLETHDNA